MPWVLITSTKEAHHTKKLLEQRGLYDKNRKITKLADNEVSIPITPEGVKLNEEEHLSNCQFSRIEFTEMQQGLMRKRMSPHEKLECNIRGILAKYDIKLEESFTKELPSHWEIHGDLFLLPEQSFASPFWDQFGSELWSMTATALGAKRLAKKSAIRNDNYRSPNVKLLFGDSGLVTHMDNGITYTYDITKCMFSSGNVTEKIRIGKLNCKGETVVDLYAGIGYFVLPYLVYGKAELVHACEWNKHAVEALRENVRLNAVENRCVIHEGDNRELSLRGIADRVNLGLIPSSEAGWPVACALLRPDQGGWLHVHGNVSSGMKANAKKKEEGASFDREGEGTCSYEQNLKTQRTMKLSTSSNEENTEAALSSLEQGCSISSRNCIKIPSCNKRIKEEWQDWVQFATDSLRILLCKAHRTSGVDDWIVSVGHLEHVKSYAPHISHLVLDVECRPLKETSGSFVPT